MSYISGGTLGGVIRLDAPATTPPVSPAGEGRIYFDGTQFLASQNGGAYAALSGGGGGGWTDDGTVVRLTTVTDRVGIGTATPTAGAKLEIVGDSTNTDVLVTAGSGAVTGGTISLIAGPGGTGNGGPIILRGGTGGSTGSPFGGDAYVQSGLPLDGSGGASGSVWIESRSTSGFTASEGTGDVTIRSGDAEGAGSGSLSLTTGNNANGGSGSISLSTGSPGGIASAGSISLSTSGGYSSGSISLTTSGGVGPGGGADITLLAAASVLVECGGGTKDITLQCNPGTPTSSVVLDDTNFTVNANLVANGADATIGDGTGTVTMDGGQGQFRSDTTGIYITPNLGIILEIGNTIKIDPDGTNNWIYGDDATVAATPGEPLTLRGGTGNTTGAGGELRLRGGAGGATGAGSSVVVTGGAGGGTSGAAGGVTVSGGTPVDGDGGSVSLTGSSGVGTNRNGGSVTISAGNSTGSGSAGTIVFNTLASSERVRITSGGRLAIGTTSPVSTLDADGSVSSGDITTVSGNTTLDDTHSVVLVDASAGAVTITLPAVSGLARRRYTIKKIDSSVNAVTVDGNGSETIDGATTQSLATQYDTIEVVTNGTEWFIV